MDPNGPDYDVQVIYILHVYHTYVISEANEGVAQDVLIIFEGR